MYRHFEPVIKFLWFDPIIIDSNISRLHHRGTFLVLFIGSFLVFSIQNFTEPIHCIGSVPKDVLNAYCWISSTFSIPSRWDVVGTRNGNRVWAPHPGIAPEADLGNGEQAIFHAYYQWVALFLFLQAQSFLIPRLLWEMAEEGNIQKLIQNLRNPLLSKEDKESQLSKLVAYLRQYRGTHVVFAIKFYICELLYFINIIAQIFVTDCFLGYRFRTYGLEALTYSLPDIELMVHSLVKVFPKVTKCTFRKYGPSGTTENLDALCVLPLNMMNEKVFIVIWFWFILLATITALYIVFLLVCILSPWIRIALLQNQGGHSISKDKVGAVLEPDALSCLEKLGDWLILYLVARNLDNLTVVRLLSMLYKNEETPRTKNNHNSGNQKREKKMRESVKSVVKFQGPKISYI